MTIEEPIGGLSPEALKARHEATAGRIEEIAARIVAIVQKDVPRFVEREVRKRWLDHPDFASAMDDQALASLKADMRQFAQAQSESLGQTLAQTERWLSATELPTERKTLEANAEVWSVFGSLACALAGFLGKHGFPSDQPESPEPVFDLAYRTPVYFIEREYCPSVIEAYWNVVEELLELVAAIEAQRAADHRKVLEARWKNF